MLPAMYFCSRSRGFRTSIASGDSGEANQDRRNHGQRHDQFTAARVKQNRPGQQSGGKYKSCLYRDQAERSRNAGRKRVLSQTRNHEGGPACDPDFEIELADSQRGQQRRAQQKQQRPVRRCERGYAQICGRIPD